MYTLTLVDHGILMWFVFDGVYCSVFSSMLRVKSRVLIVPFSLPPTGPVTTEEYEAFWKFEDDVLHHRYSTCWLGDQTTQGVRGGG